MAFWRPPNGALHAASEVGRKPSSLSLHALTTDEIKFFLHFAHANISTSFRAALVGWMVLVAFLLPFRARAITHGRTLIVIAHLDDEYYCAATAYRMAIQLHGELDELIITNGESGFRYSTLAEPSYQKNLTMETVGRTSLPAIRKNEALQAGRTLGIRCHYFLNQKDEGFTLDALAGQKAGWNFA